MNTKLDIEEVASFEYIYRVYGVPAKIGRLIKFEGKLGTILGATNCYLKIRLDGEERVDLYHPTWNIEYLEN